MNATDRNAITELHRQQRETMRRAPAPRYHDQSFEACEARSRARDRLIEEIKDDQSPAGRAYLDYIAEHGCVTFRKFVGVLEHGWCELWSDAVAAERQTDSWDPPREWDAGAFR